VMLFHKLPHGGERMGVLHDLKLIRLIQLFFRRSIA
jgi:hypothetical protein